MQFDTYEVRPERIVRPPELTAQRLDFRARAPGNPRAAFQSEIKRQYGLTAGWQRREADVLLLKSTGRSAPNLKSSSGAPVVGPIQAGKIVLRNQPVSDLASYLAFPFFDPSRLPFSKPILDRTGFKLLHSFAGGTSDGSLPWGALTLSGSTLYGMTIQSERDNLGVIFALDLSPKLAISLVDTSVSLSWSTNFPGFTLESAPKIEDEWTAVPGVTQFSATLQTSLRSGAWNRSKGS